MASVDKKGSASVYPRDLCELEQRVTELNSTRAVPCIYRVPTKVRKVNQPSYTPFRVAIGPYHRAKGSSKESPLQLMEPHKLTYLASLMFRSESPPTIYKEYTDAIERRVSDAWECYEENQQQLNLEEFKAMLLLDGAFIVEFFCRSIELSWYTHPNKWLQPYLGEAKKFISRSEEPCCDPLSEQAMKYEVLRDLILLENQLPYFILETLFELTFRGRGQPRPDKLTFGWIAYYCMDYLIAVRQERMMTFQELNSKMENTKVLHLIHLLRICCLPTDQPVKPAQPKYTCHSQDYFIHVNDEEEVIIKKTDEKKQSSKLRLRLNNWSDKLTAKITTKSMKREPDHEFRCVSVTELHNVGVRFEMAKNTRNLFEISFDASQGVIALPCVIFNDTTETFFRNIMAFEQYSLHQYHISDYMCFMDRIVDTPKDVEILERNQIVDNWLDSKETISKILNDMSGHTAINMVGYKQMAKEITAYVTKPWNKWKSMLRRDYFGTPWAIMSLCAALVLLALTAIQTIASVRSTKW